MSYCLNITCTQPTNTLNDRFCLKCGDRLHLKERYRAVDLLGKGGFGRTFLAIDEDMPSKPHCVIKQLYFSNADEKYREKAIALFQQEAVQLDELGRHPQIPQLLAHFTQNDNLYLIQEFVDGPTLRQSQKAEGCFTEKQIWQLLNDILPVLQFIHDRRIIHRDIKPDNIIQCSQTHKSILIDFGIAKVATAKNWMRTGTVIGSPEFMAPEQARGKTVPATDLYSLGVTCLALMMTVCPLDMYDINHDRWVWRDFLKEGQEVSDRLGTILDTLLKSALNQRYPSAQAVMEAIAQTNHQPTSISPPLNASTPQRLNASKAQPFNASKAQPFNTSKAQPFNTSKAQPFNTSKAQPFNTSTAQPSNTSTAQPSNTSTPSPQAAIPPPPTSFPPAPSLIFPNPLNPPAPSPAPQTIPPAPPFPTNLGKTIRPNPPSPSANVSTDLTRPVPPKSSPATSTPLPPLAPLQSLPPVPAKSQPKPLLKRLIHRFNPQGPQAKIVVDGLDYTPLHHQLSRGKWLEADQLTHELMGLAIGKTRQHYFQRQDILNLPCADIAMLNRLWHTYSKGRFGFMIQLQLFQALEADYAAFCHQVNWPVHRTTTHTYLTPSLSTFPGHFPSRRWVAGINWWSHMEWLQERWTSCSST